MLLDDIGDLCSPDDLLGILQRLEAEIEVRLDLIFCFISLIWLVTFWQYCHDLTISLKCTNKMQ